jgi:hypothetical protein
MQEVSSQKELIKSSPYESHKHQKSTGENPED